MEPNENGHKPKRNGSRKGKGNIPLETKAEMVAALPEYGSQAAVAEAFGVSRPVVTRALTDPEVLPLVRVKKEEIAQGFASLTQKLLKRYESLVDTATLTDKGVVLLGICADKALLYSGQPNSITENRGDEAMREAAARAVELIRERLQCDAAAAFEYLQRQKPELARYVQ